MNKNFITLILIIFICSCSSTPKQTSTPTKNPSSAPLWVTNKDLAFPDNQWLVGIYRDKSLQAAENYAIMQLTQRFRVDIDTRSMYREQVNETFTQMGAGDQGEFKRVTDNINNVYSTSSVNDIIGLIIDTWTDPQTEEIHAIARMNRWECTNRYNEIISENEKNIAQLITKSNQGDLFEQMKIVNYAYNLALITDDLHNIRTVLSPSYINHPPSYGSAASIKAQLPDLKNEIIIYVEVEGDVNGRILKAFTNSLNTRGFKTTLIKMNNYSLNVFYDMEELSFPNQNLKHIRYIINYSFLDPNGTEIFSNSHPDREAHSTLELAKNAAILRAEKWINSEGFAAEFDAFINQ